MLSAVFLGESDIFTVRMVIGCVHMLALLQALHVYHICHNEKAERRQVRWVRAAHIHNYTSLLSSPFLTVFMF